jgi:hypothetical protein
LDSLSAVELRNTLNKRLDTEVPATFTLDYPTISSIAGFLANQTEEVGLDNRHSIDHHVVLNAMDRHFDSETQNISYILGVAGRYPKGTFCPEV